MAATVADLRTIAEIAREVGCSWWAVRGRVRARCEAKLIRLGDRVYLMAADAAEISAALKARTGATG